jgi:hypothetical protein
MKSSGKRVSRPIVRKPGCVPDTVDRALSNLLEKNFDYNPIPMVGRSGGALAVKPTPMWQGVNMV